MRAIYLEQSTVKLKTAYADPAPAPGEVLIKVKLAGVCHTDIELARGYMGFRGVLGHEFVGHVSHIGQGVDAKWLGKRVVGEINCVCGKCEMCQRGLSTHCFRRTVLGILNHDGAFADLVRLPVRNLHEVPAHVPDEDAVFVEPIAAAVQVLRQVPIDSRTRVTVLGDGRLGQLVAQVVARTKCPLVLVGKHDEKLAVADKRGLRTQLDRDVVARRDQDVVIDCTGRAAGFQRALELVRPRGTVVLKTTVAGNPPMNLAPVVIDEITVLGSRCGPFSEAISLLASRAIDLTGLVTRRVKLDAVETLFNSGKAGEGLKTLITL